MKVLFLYASPNRNGSTGSVLSACAQELEQRLGTDVSWESVYLSDAHITPCTGCLSCRTTGSCVLPEDDADRIGNLIAQAELMVFGVPVWWAGMNGTLKNLFDRNVFRMLDTTARGFPGKRMKGKKAIVITSCGTPFPFNLLLGQSTGLLRALKGIFKPAGIKVAGVIHCAGMRSGSVPRVSVLRKAKKNVLRFARSK
jgi:putative NADPH-quinone reductase